MEVASMLIPDCKAKIVQEGGCCTMWDSVVAEFHKDIGDILPKLEAKAKESTWQPWQSALKLKHDGREIYIFSNRVYIPYVGKVEEGQALVDWAREVINKAYSGLERRPADKQGL
jgi:ArsR family metal-binding transcriptional regulator